MEAETTTLRSPTGADLYVRLWPSAPGAERSRGIVLVQHGLAEHSGRYERLAHHLVDQGIDVVAHDHRGHGRTHAADTLPRCFARVDGARTVLRDCRHVHDYARRLFGDRPVVVFGHSMGGLIALNYARLNGAALAGAAIWNANFDKGLGTTLARLGLRFERALKGSDVASRLLAGATIESWSRSISDRRTAADWLSHDPSEVDAYLADPLCGWTATVSLFDDLLDLITEGGTSNALGALPPSFPLHLLGGTQDPATDNGKAVSRLATRAERAGLTDVTTVLIEGARHETLNEAEPLRSVGLDALDRWLDRVLPDPQRAA